MGKSSRKARWVIGLLLLLISFGFGQARASSESGPCRQSSLAELVEAADILIQGPLSNRSADGRSALVTAPWRWLPCSGWGRGERCSAGCSNARSRSGAEKSIARGLRHDGVVEIGVWADG